MSKVLIIGIAGGSGSGKTTVVKQIQKRIHKDEVTILPQDAYYKDNGHLSPEQRAKINFDHPSSIEFGLLIKHLDLLKQGKSVDVPIYSYLTCARAKETIPVIPKKGSYYRRYSDPDKSQVKRQDGYKNFRRC